MSKQQLRDRLKNTRTFNYNVYGGVGAFDEGVSFDEALDEVIALIDQYAYDRLKNTVITVFKDGTYMATENHSTAIAEDAGLEGYLVTINAGELSPEGKKEQHEQI